MSDYPPGTLGAAFDDLDDRFARLAATPGPRAWPLRVWARRKRSGLAGARERLRRSIPAQLEAGGFITPEQRQAMEAIDRG